MVWNEPKFNLVTKVHVTGTSALDITVARTPQIPVSGMLETAVNGKLIAEREARRIIVLPDSGPCFFLTVVANKKLAL